MENSIGSVVNEQINKKTFLLYTMDKISSFVIFVNNLNELPNDF